MISDEIKGLYEFGILMKDIQVCFMVGDDHWCSPVDGDDAKTMAMNLIFTDSFAVIGNCI